MGLERIDLSKKERRITCLTYGLTRSGKTHFAGTWPRPYVLSDNVENGSSTLAEIPTDLWWERNWEPQRRLFAIKKWADLPTGLEEARQEFIKDRKEMTIIVDSLSFICDQFADEVSKTDKQEIARNNYHMPERMRGFLRHSMVLAHNIGAHVLWLTLLRQPEAKKSGGPAIPGQMGDKFPAACNLLLHQRVEKDDEGEQVFQLRTAQWGPYPAGSKLGKLEDPTEPVFASLASQFGIPRPVATTSVVVNKPVVQRPLPPRK